MSKKLLKSIAQSRAATFMITRLIAVYVGMMRLFLRLEVVNLATADKLLAKPEGVIIVFWHQRLILAPLVLKFSSRSVNMLISKNRDADIIVNALNLPGLNFIRGSAGNPKKREKDKGGGTALLVMAKLLKAGEVIVMTPDGPRGPARQAQIGAVKLATQLGTAILPIGLSARSGMHLRSWDKAFLPNPITRKYAVLGEPIFIPQGLEGGDLEHHRVKLEQALNECTKQADQRSGRLIRDKMQA